MFHINLLHLSMIFCIKEQRVIPRLLILAAVLFPASLFAQSEDDEMANYHLIDSIYLEENLEMNSKSVSPWKLNTTVGTSVSFVPGYGAGSSFIALPHLDFSATNRLKLHGGFIASYGLPLYNTFASETNTMSSYMNLSAFVAASYRLTDDLVVFGSGMKSMLNSGMQGFNSDFAFDDISFGAAYSIGNFTIGASFHTGPSNRYSNSPFNVAPGFNPSPIYW